MSRDLEAGAEEREGLVTGKEIIVAALEGLQRPNGGREILKVMSSRSSLLYQGPLQDRLPRLRQWLLVNNKLAASPERVASAWIKRMSVRSSLRTLASQFILPTTP